MKKKHFFKLIMAAFMWIFLMTFFNGKNVNAMPVLETDVATASDGCTMVGVYGSYYSEAQAALNRINEIRKEACDAGNVPDPNNRARMLTSSDYVPIKWSRDLESIARIRAVEGGLAYSFMNSGHSRLNGKGIFGVSYGGVTSYAEDLAYNWGTSMVSGINQWYEEKDDWVNQTPNAVTGHYTSMINPKFTYVGLGDFRTEAAVFPNTLAGQFCPSQNLDQTMQDAQKDVMQKIEVLDSYITGYTLEGSDKIYTDKTTTLTPRVNLVNGSGALKLWVLDAVTFTSSDTSVATVTGEGVVTGLKNGTVTITAMSGSKTLAVKSITVKCNHAKELLSQTLPTCTAAGKKVFSCKTCGNSMEQEIPKAAHEYVYGDADSEGYRTGICSVCKDTISIIPPTSFKLWWRNGESRFGSYSSAFPSSNPVGSFIYCWIDKVDGDSDYQDMIIESTDESVISVPETAHANSSDNKLTVLAPGITTIKIYPKYNVSLKKEVVARVGAAGSVDISSADVTLSQTSYKYNKKGHTPDATVTYHDTVLTKGTDYTVSYENNTDVGTAYTVITGKGIFKGTIRKSFTIVDQSESGNIPVGKIITVSGIRYKVVASESKKDKYTVSCVGAKSKKIRSVNIPDFVSADGSKYKVVSIGAKAFASCKKLKTVSMGKFITSIGKRAFYQCSSLTKITIPRNTKKIGAQAFAKCKKLSVIDIKSKSLTEKNVGKQAFTGISKKAVLKVPSKKKMAYRKWLRKKGLTGKKQKVK